MFDRVDTDLDQLCNHMVAPMQSDVDKLGSLIESEMHAMDEAIQVICAIYSLFLN